jgi:hypothetical protein
MDTDELIGILDLTDAYESQGINGWPCSGLSGVVLSSSKDKLFIVALDAHSMFTYNLTQSVWETKITNLKGYSNSDAISSSDRQYLYTVNSNSDSITMVNLTSGDIERIISLPDLTKPVISNVQANPSTQIQGGYVNITCTVTDNVAVSEVNVSITGPVGFTPLNITMTKIPDTNNYYYNSTYPIAGAYSYYIWVNDTSNNRNISTVYGFEIYRLNLPPTAVLLYEPAEITANSMLLSWSQNTDPDFANYTIYQSTTSGALGSAIKVITTNTTTSWTVTDLSPSRTYYFTVRVYDTSGLHNDSIQVSGITLSAQVVETIGPSGGNVTLENLTVIIPPNALSENVSFNITIVSVAPPESYGIVGSVYNIGCAVTTFTQPITITLSYAGITLPENISEDDLAIYKRADNTWNKLGGTIDKINKTISVEITALSEFAIFYKTPIEEEAITPAKPFEIPWLYIIISVIVIIVLACAAICIKHRKKALPPEKPAG